MEVEVPVVENQLCVPSVELPLDHEEAEALRADGFSRSIDSERTCATTERTLATLLEHPHQMQELPQNPEEIESLATSLAIAFKTDKLTLLKRLEIQTRLRDQSEINVANEIIALKATAQQVRPPNEDGEKCELVKKLEEQIENLHRSARYVSSAAEMYGAVQHEKRFSQAMDVIAKHVENLKQALETEKNLHIETRKLLNENKPNMTPLKINTSKRRASIATLDQSHSVSPETRVAVRKGSLIKRFGSCKSNSFSEINVGLRKIDSDKVVRNMDETGTDVDGYTEVSTECTTCQCQQEALDQSIGDEVDDGEDFETPKSVLQDEPPPSRKQHPMRYKFQKRGSFIAPAWMIKLAEEWGWLHRLGDVATQVRYAVAAACVIAAFAILSSSFFMSYDDSS